MAIDTMHDASDLPLTTAMANAINHGHDAINKPLLAAIEEKQRKKLEGVAQRLADARRQAAKNTGILGDLINH